MTIGIRIKNNNGTTVIDDRYYNLMLRQKLAGQTPVLNPANGEYHCLRTINCSTDAIIAYRSNGNFAGLITNTTLSGTQRSIEFVSYESYTIDIYVFDKPEFATISGTIGLIIRNRTTGIKVFDSRGRYMKILGFMTVTAAPNTPAYDVFNGVDKLPACVAVQMYRYDWASSFDTGSGDVAESGGDNVQTNAVGNTIRAWVREWRYETGGAGGTVFDNYCGSKLLMFIDVTGL